MSNCPYCEINNLTVPIERGFFCGECHKQVKCKNCNDFLTANKKGCEMCGCPVGEGSSNDVSLANEITPTQPLNTFEFRETKNERTAKAFLTDESVKNLSDTLTGVVTGNRLLNIGKKYELPQLNGEQNADHSQDNSKTNGTDDAITIDVEAKDISPKGSEIAKDLKSLFYPDNDKLVLEVQDLKANGQKDFGVRLVYLRLLYSKEVQNEEFILRDDLNNTLKEVMGILDPNVVNWVSKNNDLALRQEGDKTFIRLKGDGYNKALKVLEEISNAELKGTFLPEKKSRNSSKSSLKIDTSSNEAKSSQEKGKTSDIEDWVCKWSELKLNIDLHGIAKDSPILDKIVLGLWVIYMATSKSTDTLRTTKLADFIEKQFSINVTRQSFDHTLKKDVKNYVMKTPNGWKITPTGIQYAETLTKFSELTSKLKIKK